MVSFFHFFQFLSNKTINSAVLNNCGDGDTHIINCCSYSPEPEEVLLLSLLTWWRLSCLAIIAAMEKSVADCRRGQLSSIIQLQLLLQCRLLATTCYTLLLWSTTTTPKITTTIIYKNIASNFIVNVTLTWSTLLNCHFFW